MIYCSEKTHPLPIAWKEMLPMFSEEAPTPRQYTYVPNRLSVSGSV